MNEAVFFSSSTTNTRMEGVYLRASNTQHRKCAARHCARTTDCRPRAATAAWIERMGPGRPDSLTRSPYIILKPWDLEFGALSFGFGALLLFLLFLLLGSRCLRLLGHDLPAEGVHLDFLDVLAARDGNVKGPNQLALFLFQLALLDRAARHLGQGYLLGLSLGDLGLRLE